MDSKGAGTLGNYSPPERKSTISGKGPNMSSESAGLESGLSAHSKFNSAEASDIGIDYDRNPVTGNATERVTQNPKKGSATKNGNKFDIC